MSSSRRLASSRFHKRFNKLNHVRLLLILFAILGSIGSYAQSSPEGLWMSFDDDGKTPTALVRIAKSNGQLIGRIEKVLDAQSETTCSKCLDDRKNQSMVGLEIIRGAKHDAQNGQWIQGRILDPDDGTEYRLVIEPQSAGQVLVIRGYWGVFWRTQIWRKQGP
jgi:uncharacterized protein (DUF2147 family)